MDLHKSADRERSNSDHPNRANRFTVFFALIVGAIGGVVSILMANLYTSQARTQQDHIRSVLGLDLGSELQYQTQEARWALLYALVTDDADRRAGYTSTSRQAERVVSTRLRTCRSLLEWFSEDQLAHRLEQDWTDFLRAREQVIILMESNRANEAAEIDLRLGMPAFNRVRDDLRLVQQLFKLQSDRLLKQSETSLASSLVRAVFVLGLCLICSFISVKVLQKGDLLRAARASEARLRKDLESISEELLVVDSGMRVLQWNETAERNWKRSRAELIGRPLDEALPSLLDTPLADGLQTALKEGRGTVLPDLKLHREGEERVCQARVFPFHGGASVFLHDITQAKRAESELAELNRQIAETQRQAGMAEVATGVLHNVGNVLNSINVSATLVREQLAASKLQSLVKVTTLIREHLSDLGTFFTQNPQGRKVPEFLFKVTDHLSSEHERWKSELSGLTKNIEHIKEIVAMQQSYARLSGVVEPLAAQELVEDALRINEVALGRHGIHVRRKFDSVPAVAVDKHKVLQILINLIRNAKQAIEDNNRDNKELTLSITHHTNGPVAIAIADSGVGIAPENLTRIFSHGFTTKRSGHGFGLHSAANAAREMGGKLSVQSEGPGKGATFVLDLPVAKTPA
ncbi:MAG TPA: ATP-binding protein [Verrucomicrobiae bacterium]|nr:ATP-binding protein [Verrucomicrobiae bacterium]